MAKVNSFIQKGDKLDYTNSTGTDIGYLDIVVVNNKVYIASAAIANGATGILEATGVWEFPAVATTAFSFGDKIYYDATAGNVNKTASGNSYCGLAVAAKASSGTSAWVNIGSAVLS